MECRSAAAFPQAAHTSQIALPASGTKRNVNVCGNYSPKTTTEGSWKRLVEPMGFESANCMETKEFCGAAWPSKVLKGKEGNS
jgi:hypothetical protein